MTTAMTAADITAAFGKTPFTAPGGYSFQEAPDNLSEADAVRDAIDDMRASRAAGTLLPAAADQAGTKDIGESGATDHVTVCPAFLLGNASPYEDDSTLQGVANDDGSDAGADCEEDEVDSYASTLIPDEMPPTDEEMNDAIVTSLLATMTTAALGASSVSGGKTAAIPTSVDVEMLIEDSTEEYLDQNRPSLVELCKPYSRVAASFRAGLISYINGSIKLYNAAQTPDGRFKTLSTLPGYVMARVLVATGDVRRMITGTEGYRTIVKRYYTDRKTGETRWSGTYAIHSPSDSNSPLARAVHAMNPNRTKHDLDTFEAGLANAPACTANGDDKLVFWRNGVWDYRSQRFTSYDDPRFDELYPDSIALAKLPVYHPLGPGAIIKPDADGKIREPVIHNDRDGTDWMPSQVITDPFDVSTAAGQASVLVLWQAMQFMIRKVNGLPRVYHFWVDVTGRGHNGKGTIWDMFHRLIEKDLTIDDEDLRMTGRRVIPLRVDELDEPYVLGQNLLTAYAIAGEETDGAVTYVKKCATFKMLSRAQEITVRAIREAPFSFAFNGFLLQQSNKAPQFSEKNDSVLSHAVVINFDKSFGDSRSYIKDDYVKREEVAEWLAYRLTVEMQCLTEYDAKALEILAPNKKDMMSESMNSFQFLDDVMPGLRMNFIPCEFLYDLYLRWCDKSGVSGPGVMQFKIFRDDCLQYSINHGDMYDFTRKASRTSIKDVDVKHPALAQFCRSQKHNLTKYCHPRAREFSGYSEFCSQLNRSEWMSNGGAGKLWNKGGIIRTIKWQDLGADMASSAEPEDIGYDEDAGINTVMKEVNRVARTM